MAPGREREGKVEPHCLSPSPPPRTRRYSFPQCGYRIIPHDEHGHRRLHSWASFIRGIPFISTHTSEERKNKKKEESENRKKKNGVQERKEGRKKSAVHPAT
jgi:hypothetical protein